MMRVSRDGGRSYSKRRRQRLSTTHPHQPTTISVYNPELGSGSVLVLDFDVSKAIQAPNPVAQVRADADDCAALITRCGGRYIADVAPRGGRHLYILWATPQPWQELYLLALALRRRYPHTLDITPNSSPHGQIRPPGSRYKSINGHSPGFQELSIPLPMALTALAHPNDAHVWARLQQELTAELAHSAPIRHAPSPDALSDAPPSGWRSVPRDIDDEPWLPREGGRSPLRPDLAQIAVTGNYDPTQFDPGTATAGHAARVAVLNSLAARGWRLNEVRQLMQDGTWPGLASLFARYRPSNRDSALVRDWKNAIDYILQQESVRDSDTRESSPPAAVTGKRVKAQICGPWPLEVSSENQRSLLCRSVSLAPPYHLDPYQQIRTWWNAVLLAEQDAERMQGWGRAATSVRLVLRALGAAGQMTGLTAVEFGVRSLSLMTGLHYDTVAQVLRTLREENDAFIYRVETQRGERGDLYLLQLPDKYREMALWQRWRAGNIQALHPVFRLLGGGTTALVYEHLTTAPTSRNDLIRLAVLSPTTVSEALAALLQYGLAERTPQGWIRGPEDLDILADFLGAGTLVEALRDTYRQHRAQWHAYLTRSHVTIADIVDATPKDGHIPIEPAWHDREPVATTGTQHRHRSDDDDDLQRLADAEVPPWLDDHLGGTDHIPELVPDRDPIWEHIWGKEVETGLNPLRSFCRSAPRKTSAKGQRATDSEDVSGIA
ncbi:hypothetical protein [Streptosporangium sp. CA-115845]|uniref:hypothetical protein n=1 Tax=Streptosporangium sp. CA-115845 TaxID=3240071 RepID=UPI003D8F427E